MGIQISAVLLDVEGVLVEKAGKPVRPLFFHHLQDGQGTTPFGVCTGRPQPYAERVLQELGPRAMSKIPSIVENGCFLMNGSVLTAHPLLKANMEKLLAIKPRLLLGFGDKMVIEPGKEVCISMRPTQGAVEELFAEVKEFIQRTPEWAEITHVTHSNSAVDVTPAGVTKGAGLAQWSAVTGIDVGSVLGVGDANNDLEWLRLVGIPSCPANASDDVKSLVKERGGHVASQLYEAGTLDILKHYNVL